MSGRAAQDKLMGRVAQAGGQLPIAGIIECRAVLDLVAQGRLRIASGEITQEGGSGWVKLPPARRTRNSTRDSTRDSVAEGAAMLDAQRRADEAEKRQAARRGRRALPKGKTQIVSGGLPTLGKRHR
jgi:hypothetical protein